MKGACGLRNRGKFCVLNPKCWTLESGIPLANWNPESKFYWQRLELSTWNLESTLWNPQSKTVLDSLTWVEILLHKPHQSIPELTTYKLKMKLTVLFEVCCVHFWSSNSFIKKYTQSFRLEFADRKSACGFINEIWIELCCKVLLLFITIFISCFSTIS